MSEHFAIETWLYETLTGDPAIVTAVTGVYANRAPQGTACPYIQYGLQVGTDAPVFGTGARTNETAYLVRCIDHARSMATAAAVADLIDTALEKASGSVGSATIVGSIRISPFSMAETTDGEVYSHAGGIYRIWAQEA